MVGLLVAEKYPGEELGKSLGFILKRTSFGLILAKEPYSSSPKYGTYATQVAGLGIRVCSRGP